MANSELSVVTGALSYTGRYITERLLEMGGRVRTLTGHPGRPNPFGSRVEVVPFDFQDPGELRRSLEGAVTLYNTYWIRFPYRQATYDLAVQNTRTLLRAAEEAGVRKVVQISIANASKESHFPYYRGKAAVEEAVIGSSMAHAIIRPTMLFGHGDILINNIAWMLRRFPLFGVPGSGRYRLQPVHVEDVAGMAVDSGENTVQDAAGPEVFTFNELVRLIRDEVKGRARIVHTGAGTAYLLTRLLGLFVKDVVLTWDEVAGLMAGLLVSHHPPEGKTLFSDWLRHNAHKVGTGYASELQRHYR
jgi:uncharacterized protein YbjT (DUF2867 family)